jgi:adenosylhomocysteine nucleosidase
VTVIIKDAPEALRTEGTFLVARRPLPVLAVTGFAHEARLTAAPGVTAIWAGGDPDRLRSILDARMQPDCRAVVSIGIAGGLDPKLAPGDVIVATGVAAPNGRYEASRGLAFRLAARLAGHTNLVVLADLAGVDAAVISPEAKLALRHATGASAVDMESHVAAHFAAAHRLPFTAVRVVCDPADRTLPHLAANVLRSDGEIDLLGLLGGLVRRPMHIAVLARLACDFVQGCRALRLCRDLLGLGFGVPAFGEFVGEP